SPLFSANHERAQPNIQTCVLDKFTRPIYHKLRGAGLVPSVHASLAGSREARALRGESTRATGGSLMQDRLGRMSGCQKQHGVLSAQKRLAALTLNGDRFIVRQRKLTITVSA